LNFKKFEILKAARVQKINLSNREKFRGDRLSPYRDIAIFTARRSYASAVLGVVILSVRLSVCHTRAL